jgi:hypothetical protein
VRFLIGIRNRQARGEQESLLMAQTYMPSAVPSSLYFAYVLNGNYLGRMKNRSRYGMITSTMYYCRHTTDMAMTYKLCILKIVLQRDGLERITKSSDLRREIIFTVDILAI